MPFDRFSSYTKLVRVVAWVLRFSNNLKSNCQATTSAHLTTPELYKAERHLLLAAQSESFQSEIAAIKSNKNVSKSSNLKHLYPFLDEDGLLRAKGRIENSQVPHQQKHPLILKGNHAFTKLLIRMEHVRLLHGGPTQVLTSLSSKYYIIGGYKSIRSITRQCTTCRRNNARTTSQLVGQLPKERVTPGPIFENVGVDYAGPLLLKVGRVRKPTVVKTYICLFVSMSVKAVHLEAVTDLSTRAFLAALKRFISRRGIPSTIHSDHGTNFVGADKLTLKASF